LREGDALVAKGEFERAGAVLNSALNCDPNHPGALWSLAYCYMKAEKWGMAYTCIKRAIELWPGNPQVYKLYCNLGAATLSMASTSQDDKFLDEAEGYLLKGMKRADSKNGIVEDQDVEQALNHLALISLFRAEPERAIHFAERSLKKNGLQKDVLETLGYAQLMLGRWKEGFYNYDFSVNSHRVRKLKPFHGEPFWDGSDGVKLFVRGEQGIGDEISYASCLGDAVKHGNKVTYECDKRLEGLMRRSFPEITVHGTRFSERDWSGEFDFHCLSGSLAREYRQTGESFPRKAFLTPDPERQTQWRALLDTLPGKKVGIAWSGGLPNTFSGRRSFTTEKLMGLFSTPGITWVSLQYKDAERDIEALQKKGVSIHHWERAVGKSADYDETAALVSQLDCVVSVCTAVVHLCGAIGQKCFVLVPSRPRWWYGLAGTEHAWYESLELFRQKDKWPLDRLQQRLGEYLELKKAA
jgi:hypothetical protein